MPVANRLWMKMNMNIVMLFVICIFSCQLYADQWVYQDVIDSNRIIRIETNPDNLVVDGSFRAVYFCPDDSKYICIKADNFTFHFPRKMNQGLKSWSVEGEEYIVISKHPASYYGSHYEVYSIKKEASIGTFLYVFSKEAGLLAIGGRSANNSTMYLLDSKCGFGASEKCVQHQQ